MNSLDAGQIPLPSAARPVISVLLFLTFALGAFAAQATAPAAPAAAEAWAAVLQRSAEAAGAKVPQTREIVARDRAEATRLKQERATRAAKFREAAQAAREFQLRYPQHPEARQARLLEVLSSIQGITPDDPAYERVALANVAAFRATPSHPVGDRIQAAHAAESLTLARRTLGRPWFAHAFLAESMLDRLRREFGEQPEIWGLFLALAEDAPCDAGRDTALRVYQSDSAPMQHKLAARRILERYQLVRQPLDFPLTTAQGVRTTLSQLAGKSTVLCFWDGAKHPAGPPGLRAYVGLNAPGTKWVYVSVGALAAPSKGRSGDVVAPPGVTCVEASGRASPLLARLHLTRLPWVCVLDERGRVSGYGRVDEIPDLLKGIGRPALP